MFSFLKSRSRGVLLAGGVIAVIGTPAVAIGAGEGLPVDGGARNPDADQRQNYTRETEIIANVNTYGTRQSNKSDNGGGAVYGCRSKAGGTTAKNEPCLRATNLSDGNAFEFNSGGALGGWITVGSGGDQRKPFTTNATGVATGLNADRVDGVEGADIARAGDFLFARVGEDGSSVAGSRPAGASATAVNAQTSRVTFGKDVSACSFTATPNGTPTALAASPTSGDGRSVDVSSEAANLPAFHLQVMC